MALHSLYCADVPLRNCSLTHSLTVSSSALPPAAHRIIIVYYAKWQQITNLHKIHRMLMLAADVETDEDKDDTI